MTPRTLWLRDRVREVVAELHRLEAIEDWAQYQATALDLSKELQYAVTEWQKYYNEV